MALFLVTWDLNKQRANYTPARNNLISYLSNFSHIKDPGLNSVWFIEAHTTAADMVTKIEQHLHPSDRLFVTLLIRGQCEGYVSDTVVKWVNART
ncbi:hypothetical protein [Bradyrhizobium sp. CCGE-LA001]|uniref:hypothetical protein n=1 Tax=Bradyrhizobium sp. CCGE-LA001 TaxID=1223566 RepID=UPI0002AAE376|nr:hypothetical protein [Bradyrhizobium sp. CCGE-LA001]AMA58057.1 hypothetical protein BCCGELA001_18415 [Bradyrhizobium sp. CCGE-LA001]